MGYPVPAGASLSHHFSSRSGFVLQFGLVQHSSMGHMHAVKVGLQLSNTHVINTFGA